MRRTPRLSEIDRIANTACPLPEREQRIAKLKQEIDRLRRLLNSQDRSPAVRNVHFPQGSNVQQRLELTFRRYGGATLVRLVPESKSLARNSKPQDAGKATKKR